MSTLGNLVWVLPRPRIPAYKGSFPLHFETRLWRLLGKPKLVLHQFGGRAEIGIKVDLRREVGPHIIADAQKLPFKSNVFDAVICDPPYSKQRNLRLYGLKRDVKYSVWIKEAERVLRQKGFLVLYHERWLPRPKSCEYWMRVIVLVGQHHRPRVVGIFQKGETVKEEEIVVTKSLSEVFR